MLKEQESAFLEAVEERIVAILAPRPAILPHHADILSQASRHLCVAHKAKRARPMLCYYFAKALDVPVLQVVDAAVAAELIHSASLLHDDVIDDASTRRGRETVNIHYSNSVAVLAGNYLLATAFELLNSYPQSLVKDAVEVIADMTRAAIAELEIRGKIDVSMDVWKAIAQGKTGALFAWCGQAVASISGQEDAHARAWRVGRHIGIIFQMADDIKDLLDASGLKERFADIRNQEPSSVLIEAWKLPACRQAFQDACGTELDESTIRSLGESVLRSEAIAKTQETMRREVQAALDALGYLLECDGGKQIAYWLSALLY